MSDMQKKLLEVIQEAIPKMTTAELYYMLGRAEQIAESRG